MKREARGVLAKLSRVKNDLFSGTAVEIHCGAVTYICGCEKVTSYTNSCIEMDCTDAKIIFEGKELGIDNLINGQIAITGKIKRAEFVYD